MPKDDLVTIDYGRPSQLEDLSDGEGGVFVVVGCCSSIWRGIPVCQGLSECDAGIDAQEKPYPQR